jgi:hypothetical protein
MGFLKKSGSLWCAAALKAYDSKACVSRIVLSAIYALFAMMLLDAQGASAQTLCIYDPLGAAGDYYALFKDYQLEAQRWNVHLNLEPYPDDRQLIVNFENGHCDMASMIGLRARKYVKFTGTIDAAPGTLSSYIEVRNLLSVLAQPKVGRYLAEGKYENVGILPLGAGYAVVADRNILSLRAAAGKRVLVPSLADNLDELLKQLKLVKVPTEVQDYGRAFAQGKADIVLIPMLLFKPLEIDKALTSFNGGILRRPLFEFTMQVIDHADKFPPGFGQQSREYIYHQIDHTLSMARNLENQTDARFWLYVKRSDFEDWDETNRSVAAEMARQGILDRRLLSLTKRIRCATNPDEPECRDLNLESKPQAVGAGH